MKLILKQMSNIVNNIHDIIMSLFKLFGFNFTDKQLHFIVIGIIGIILYFITNIIFKKLARLSIRIISFIYTITVLIVLVFGLEIEQKITGRGNMEFADIVAGLWGFLFIFAIYLFILGSIYLFKLIFKKSEKVKELS
ncbi:MAG: hypothetical protein LIR50_07050 [Bacillota bacterium]|nr:hypothetical protein [Bacillota bacterium]